MKTALIPFYVSRLILAAAIGFALVLKGSVWWVGAGTALALFLLFVWYAHSGRFIIDPTTPLTPLRRDDRAKVIRDRAVVWSVAIGGTLTGVLRLAGSFVVIPVEAGWMGVLTGIISYFLISSWPYVVRS